MDLDRARAFLLSLPHVVETQQWGDNLVFWVGDKALGGKMFCVLSLDGVSLTGSGEAVASCLVGRERYADLLEQDGLRPAPYFARIFWVAAERWSAWRNAEWEIELRSAHELTLEKLPKRVRESLALPAGEQQKLIVARRTVLAKKTASKKAG